VQEPPLATQTAITLSGTSQASAAFHNQTRIVRVWTDADEAVFYLVGAAPTATTATGPLETNEAGFAYLAVKPGMKIAVRTA
jgi:hypothetical protein